MSVTAGEIRRRVQSSMADESTTFIKDADVFDWISDAQEQISIITECLTSNYTLNVTADTELYSVDSAFLRIVYARYQNRKLRYTTLEMIEQIDPDRFVSVGSGEPTHFFLEGGQLGLWPRPASSITGALKIRARILASTAIVNDASTLIIPDFFREHVVKYCMIKAREKDEQAEVAAQLLQDWMYKLGIAKSVLDNPNAASYQSVLDIETGLDFFPEWYSANG